MTKIYPVLKYNDARIAFDFLEGNLWSFGTYAPTLEA
jgi:hypothetical protein